MINPASATVPSTSQICEPRQNYSESVFQFTIKKEKLSDIEEHQVQTSNSKVEISNGELSFDSQFSSGEDSTSDRKFRRKNSRPQKVTMIAEQQQQHSNQHQLPSLYLHQQLHHSTQLVPQSSTVHEVSSGADPFASLVVNAPDTLSIVASGISAMNATGSHGFGLCETCGSPLTSIRNSRGLGALAAASSTGQQSSSTGNDEACDFLILCVDCTCDKISLLLEENDSCGRGGDPDSGDVNAAGGSGGGSGENATSSTGSPSVYVCRLCQPSMMFATSRDFLEHYVCEHEQQQQQQQQQQLDQLTPKQEATIPADDELDSDVAAADAAEAYRCSHCGLGFRSEDDVEQHERFHLECEFDSTRLRCFYCCKEFNELDALNAHQRAHSTDRPHQCTVCDRSFSFACTLQRHMLVHQAFHSTYVCHYCDQTFSDAGQLDRHFDVCERNLDDAAGLSPSDSSRPGAANRFLPYSHTCSTCGKSFRLAWRYKLHMRAACNTSDKYNADSDRTCSICKKMFANPMNLHRHELIHAGIRNYQCKLCGKAFVQKTQLETHMNIHNGIKPFQCEVCGKTFTDRSTFHKHKKIHVKPKSFPCTVCGKMFNQAGYLKLHAKVHGNGDGAGNNCSVQQGPIPIQPKFTIGLSNPSVAVAVAAANVAAATSAATVSSGLSYCNLDQ